MARQAGYDRADGAGRAPRHVGRCCVAIAVTALALVACIAVSAWGRAPGRPVEVSVSGPKHDLTVKAAKLRELLDNDLHTEARPQAVVQCTVDVTTAVAYLALSVISAEEAADLCTNVSEQAECGVSVTVLITSLVWIASYVSIVSQSCSLAAQHPLIDRRADCATDVITVVGALMELATSSQGVLLACGTANIPQGNVSANATAGQGQAPRGLDFESAFSWRRGAPVVGEAAIGRRLRSMSVGFLSANGEEKRIRQKVTLCTFDILQEITYIIAAAFQIHSAAMDCPDPRNCAVDILNAISSIVCVMQFAALAVTDCPVEDFLDAACAAEITNMVGNAVTIAATAPLFHDDCSDL